MNRKQKEIPPKINIQHSVMSAQTKDFIQRMCFRQTESLDMRRYGFVTDSHPLKLFLKPLRMQLEKIHGKGHEGCNTEVPIAAKKKKVSIDIEKLNDKTKSQRKKSTKK